MLLLIDDEQDLVADGVRVVTRRRQPYGRPLLPRSRLLKCVDERKHGECPLMPPPVPFVQGVCCNASCHSHHLLRGAWVCFERD